MSVKRGFNQKNSLLRSYPWKKYSHFNRNGLLICPKKFYLIKTCALISNEALKICEDQRTSSNQAKCNVGHANDPFRLQSE